MQLSPHFYLNEFTVSQTATRYGLDNTPSPAVIANLQNLCVKLLEPLRARVGPIKINSGYRSSIVNSRVGGASNSQHLYGEAADIIVPGVSVYDVSCLIRDEFLYDQVIFEFGQWTHVSLRMLPTQNRKMPLTAMKKDGKTVYVGGIIPL
jgi:zinc D-Ala-D-Ala carboxypeptidase